MNTRGVTSRIPSARLRHCGTCPILATKATKECTVISHHHQTIFIHIPKCGGQSIEAAFLADLGLTWELRAPLLLRPNEEPRLGPPRLAHLLARDYVHYHYLSSEIFESYYSFSVLRDPAARVISLFNYLRPRDGQQIPMSFAAFLYEWIPRQFEFRHVEAALQNAPGNSYHFIRPQVDFVTDAAGRVMVDDLFLLENIRDGFVVIKKRSNLRSPLEHRNKSVAHFKREDLSRKDEDFIRAIYAADYDFISANLKSAGT